MFDNESAFISSPAKGAGPCCHRSPCDLHDKAANKPCTAATAAHGQNAALSQHIPKNYGAGSSKGQKSPGLQRQICMLRSHGEENHRPQTVALKHEALQRTKSLQPRLWGGRMRYHTACFQKTQVPIVVM